jgi:serine/threonine-protein kinase
MAERASEDRDRPAGADERLDEERLAQALVGRGLVTAEEVQACRSRRAGDPGPKALLTRLVAGRALTRAQARRVYRELTALLGEQIPGYQLLEKLGQGSMGVVFKARQVSMNRLVAVKILHGKLASSERFLERFVREAHLAARLSHNNVVQAIDVGSAGPLHYFVMELVEGQTIRKRLDAGEVFEEREAVDIVLQVAQALGHAHRRGLIHRDVKPSNIVLTADGVAKLADLGLARSEDDAAAVRSERGLTFGTPHYIAPEQILGRSNIDGRADLYSLGATLYHMVTGQPPYSGKGAEQLFRAHLEAELTPPDHLNPNLSAGLGEVVELLLAKDRRHRYRNADDLAIDLECLLAGDPPKLARQRIEADTLRGLAEGEAEPGEEERERPAPAGGPPHGWLWVAVLGTLLGLSALLNLVLLLHRS